MNHLFHFQVENFAIAALASSVLKRDVSKFAWMYPTDYLQQKALYVFDARLFGNV
jgi:hypothetical protein